MRWGLYLPPFGELADPRVLAELGAQAEAAGFDGVFLWDHVVRPERPGLEVGDAWIGLAAIAAATRRVIIGTRITPLSRRRPQVVARQGVALDQLSGGRFVLGAGLGSDRSGELSRLGEETDPRVRAAMLDEGLEVIRRCWSGEPVSYEGRHYKVDGLTFRPAPRPRVPIWVAAQSVRRGPLRRAARFDGLCPETGPDGLVEMLGVVREHRQSLEGFEVAVSAPPGADPDPYRRAGATWWLVQAPAVSTADEVAAIIETGRP
ncbi:LLM class flavin-dependent oxidoreductase [Nonomuraea ceibae]|uniref:LLM class flavin-dependent oxidoreductase n=1 Tax=Nonomuraea ceibae TaxID=1935170 RepID=UPI001C5E8CB1|nr:LLM class flavin-dependent oxidoreductase [Nonomuraea ceibae]